MFVCRLADSYSTKTFARLATQHLNGDSHFTEFDRVKAKARKEESERIARAVFLAMFDSNTLKPQRREHCANVLPTLSEILKDWRTE